MLLVSYMVYSFLFGRVHLKMKMMMMMKEKQEVIAL